MSTATASPCSTQAIEERIAPLRARLTGHPLYSSIRTQAQLRSFMESHVFAVWDFMSLLKALQAALTCVAVPWVPTPLPDSRRFINEIVLGEESDQFEGRAISHFELYLEAMQQAGADTAAVDTLLRQIRSGAAFVPETIAAPPPAQAFLRNTFATIAAGKPHAMAAAFTFGREDVIPDMFRQLVRDLNQQTDGSLAKFVWYLERHIEVDGEDHGPLSLRMVADLCGEGSCADEAKWLEAAAAAEQAIAARIALWDGILAGLPAV